MLRTTVLPAVMALLGLVILVQAVVTGDAVVTRLLLGVLFLLAGGLRLYAERR
jgi:hypothetical protein